MNHTILQGENEGRSKKKKKGGRGAADCRLAFARLWFAETVLIPWWYLRAGVAKGVVSLPLHLVL